MNLNQITVPAIDMADSVDFYRRLGLNLIVSTPDYARFECPQGQATFSLHRVERRRDTTDIVVYFEIEALDRKVADLQQAGLEFLQPPTDEPWLWREARLLDPVGNLICLYWAGENRLNPPWRIVL